MEGGEGGNVREVRGRGWESDEDVDIGTRRDMVFECVCVVHVIGQDWLSWSPD